MNLRNLLLIAIPSAIYVGHAAMYWHWLIDDAGISFAYAFNLATGNGLVAQVGAPPVEGFSNPLWTFLLAGTVAIGVFSPYWTAKVLACALAVATFGMMLWIARRTAPDNKSTSHIFLAAAVLTALNPAFVIWTGSGLENGLYAALVIALSALLIKTMGATSLRISAAAGLCAGLIALTRPDGIAYAPAFILALSARSLITKNTPASAVKNGALYLACLLLVVGPYQLFRISYFGDVLPNTYYAKQGASISEPFLIFLRGDLMPMASGLFDAFTPTLGFATFSLFVLFPLLAATLPRSQQVLNTAVLYLIAAVSIFIFFALPPDWMGEYRFATPFFPVASLLTMCVLWGMKKHLLGERRAPRTATLLAAGLFAFTCIGYLPRMAGIPKSQAATLDDVSSVALAFNRYKASLGLDRATFMSPDMGGTLIYSESKAIDGWGLCDREIAKAIHRPRDEFRSLILDEIKPTFIFVNAMWHSQTGLLADPRFQRDYAEITTAHFVRKDVFPPEVQLSDALSELATPGRKSLTDAATAFPFVHR